MQDGPIQRGRRPGSREQEDRGALFILIDWIQGRLSRPQAKAAVGGVTMQSIASLLERRDTGSDDRAYAHIGRGALKVASVLAATLLLALAVIFRMLPLQRQTPMVMTVWVDAKSGSPIAVGDVQNLQQGLEDWPLIERHWVSEYVRIREEILPFWGVMTPRVDEQNGWIRHRSSDEVFQGYRRISSLDFISEMVRTGRTRTVLILETKSLGNRVYQVSYVLKDLDQNGKETNSETWVTTLQVNYFKPKIPVETLRSATIDNIFGFTVVQYAQTKSSTSK